MSPEITVATHEQASTEAVPSDHDRRRRLITALAVLAVLAIVGVALYALGLIAVAAVLLLLSALLGGFLSIPAAGVLQQLIVAIWHGWKDEHPDQFPPEGTLPRQPGLLTEQPGTPIGAPAPDVKR